MMTLQALLIALIVVGAVLYVLQLLPIDATFKRIAFVIVIIIFAIYAIRFLFTLSLLP